MSNIMIEFISEFSYIALFLLIAIENIFPPIPSEIILGSAGFLCALGHMNVFLAIICSVCASIFGAYLLYKIGACFDRSSLLHYLSTKGKWMHIPVEHVDKAFDAFNKYGYASIFFLRFIPVVRSLISIPAGMNHMKLSVFIGLSTLATTLWNSLIIGVGYYTQENYEFILAQFTSNFKIIILLLFGIVFIGWCTFRLVKAYQR